jgi:hypothetical protein
MLRRPTKRRPVRFRLKVDLDTQLGDKTQPQAMPRSLTVDIEHPGWKNASRNTYEEHCLALEQIVNRIIERVKEM